MKIHHSHYTLKGRLTRHGALLRVEYPDGKIGYTDLHPWPELGDEPLHEQYSKLKKGQLTNLAKRSLYFAKIDADARAKGINLLEGKQIPHSHYLAHIGEEIPDEGWTTVKIKVTVDQIPALLKYIPTIQQKIRIDCNSQTDLDFIDQVNPFLDRIEFIEDPAPYKQDQWKKCLSNYKVKFAIDRLNKEILEDLPQCINIYKPAVECYMPHPNTVVTSYLGHPLGQVCAAYEASLLPTKLIAGLQSHRVYQPNSFSERLNPRGPEFTSPGGLGFGFDDLLEALDWLE